MAYLGLGYLIKYTSNLGAYPLVKWDLHSHLMYFPDL